MIEQLAKLLATENIVVEHRATRTASFDTENRVLTLPMWKDITPTLEALLVGHEVGHALYTPADGWKSIPAKEKMICNIIEDPRIERKIKIKYPGLRRDFYDGYKELFENDFFEIKNRNIEEMNFLDRLNIHFKLGVFQKVNFSEKELTFVTDIENAMTWSEVVDITHRVFEFIQTKKEEENNAGELNEDLDDKFNEDLDGELNEDLDGELNEDLDDELNEDLDDELNEDLDDELISETQNAMETNVSEKLIDQSSKPIIYVNVRDVDYKNRVYSYSELFSMFNDEEIKYRESYNSLKPLQFDTRTKEQLDEIITKPNLIRWNKFLKVNSKVVSYLVKEFEMKKAADQYVKRREGKTGVINCNKLHAYKIIDDIFKKTTIVPESKNHGLIMFVDFSGSMSENMKGTIEQLLCLTLFCRRINIPHRVYAFTNQKLPEEFKHVKELMLINNGDITVPDDHVLFELFTEKMRNDEFSRMGKYLLNFAQGYANPNRRFLFQYGDKLECWFHSCITLNSTPLNSALILARKIIIDFKKQTNAQIVNCVILTDGESDPSQYYFDYPKHTGTAPFRIGGDFSRKIVRDIQTKKEIELIKSKKHEQHTDIFVDFLRKRCNINVICYRIEKYKRQIKNTLYDYYNGNENKMQNDYKKGLKQNYFSIKGHMKFDDYFLILDKNNMTTEESLMDENTFQTKNALAKAFIKANEKRGTSRILLSKFIEKIAA